MCLSTCPDGTIANFERTYCINLDDLDASYYYFPVTQIMLGLIIVSCVGRCVKPRHQILSNFIIMMSMLEHLSIIAQVFLAFIYANAAWGFVAIIIWAAYCIL